MVAALEARLGVKLLLRTTRQITPTDAGTAFLERARQILDDLDDAENAARGIDSLQGLLRVAMPDAFGTREIIPRLPPFVALHPRLRFGLVISARTDDLVAEGWTWLYVWGGSPIPALVHVGWLRLHASRWPRQPIWPREAARHRLRICLSTTASSGRVCPPGKAGVLCGPAP
jgi:DNA-binding transcriptional LysR family regulator